MSGIPPMGEREAAAALGFDPFCDCRHDADDHKPQCQAKDSYGAPCGCPAYSVSPDSGELRACPRCHSPIEWIKLFDDRDDLFAQCTVCTWGED